LFREDLDATVGGAIQRERERLVDIFDDSLLFGPLQRDNFTAVEVFERLDVTAVAGAFQRENFAAGRLLADIESMS
jgi:hypothetical protein